VEATTYAFTRDEMADLLRERFERPGLVRQEEVLEALADRGAPQEMSELVAARIPVGAWLTDMRALWVYLRDVPLERERS
jgi:hypothetical protein